MIRTISRLNPSILSYSLIQHHFKLIKTIYPPLYKPSLLELNYAYYFPNYSVPIDQIYSINNSINNKSPTKLSATILDITDLEYPFKYLPTPDSTDKKIKFANNDRIDFLYSEIVDLKQAFEIKTLIDGYKISNNTFLFFNNDSKLIQQ